MIHQSAIDLRVLTELASIDARALRVEQAAKRALLDQAVGRGRRVQVIIYSWQVRVKISGGLRVMRTWMPGQGVPHEADRLELTARACLARQVAAVSPLLQPKGVG